MLAVYMTCITRSPDAPINALLLSVDLWSLASLTECFKVLKSDLMLSFWSLSWFTSLSLSEEVGVRTISPEDVASEGSCNCCIDWVQQVNECEREVNEWAHAECCALPSSASCPWEHW